MFCCKPETISGPRRPTNMAEIGPRVMKTRNPRTGDPIEIAASVQPKFRAGKGLKDALNG